MVGRKKIRIQEYWSGNFSLVAVCFDGCIQVTEPVFQLSVFNVSVLQ